MRALSIALIVALVFTSIQPALAVQSPEDDRIYDDVRRRLANNPDVKGGAIEVVVEKGVVTLRGKVLREKQKTKASQVAGKVKGVKRVVNELQAEMK